MNIPSKMRMAFLFYLAGGGKGSSIFTGFQADAPSGGRGQTGRSAFLATGSSGKNGATGRHLVEETEMKKYLLGAAMLALMTSSALAEKIGVSMALFDDN